VPVGREHMHKGREVVLGRRLQVRLQLGEIDGDGQALVAVVGGGHRGVRVCVWVVAVKQLLGCWTGLALTACYSA
jgi:hypothetical protein